MNIRSFFSPWGIFVSCVLVPLLCLFFQEPELSVTNIWRLNVSESHEMFRVYALAVSPSGTVATFDRFARNVVFFDVNGNAFEVLDKKGEGPGELNGPQDLRWSKDAFAIFDYSNGRISFWREDGTFWKETPLRGGLTDAGFTKDGKLFGFFNVAGMRKAPDMVHYSLASGEAKVLVTFPKPTIQWSTAGSKEQPILMRYRWNPVYHLGVGRDFLVTAYGDDHELRFWDFFGKSMGKPMKCSLPKFPVSTAQINDAIENMPKELQQSMRSGLVQPGEWPRVNKILVDDSDRIWVFSAAPDLNALHHFQVLKRDGTSLGKGKIASLPLAVGGDILYHYTYDRGGELHLEKTKVLFP